MSNSASKSVHGQSQKKLRPAEARRQLHRQQLKNRLQSFSDLATSIDTYLLDDDRPGSGQEDYPEVRQLVGKLTLVSAKVEQSDVYWMEVLERFKEPNFTATVSAVLEVLRHDDFQDDWRSHLAERLKKEHEDLRDLFLKIVGKTLTDMYLPPL